jgi:hypothetical protein
MRVSLKVPVAAFLIMSLFGELSLAAGEQCVLAFREEGATILRDRRRQDEVERKAAEHAYAESQKMVPRMKFWSFWRNAFRKYNGSIESHYIVRQRREKQHINWYLIQGESAGLAEHLGALVTRTEASYEKAKYTSEAIRNLRAEIENSHLPATAEQLATIREREAQRDAELERFISNFRDYKQKMELLEETAESGVVQDPNANLFAIWTV